MKRHQQPVNYHQLFDEYSNPGSLQYKKMRIIDSFIPSGNTFLDIGMGTGELINIVKSKFNVKCGFDPDHNSYCICCDRFREDSTIQLFHGKVNILKSLIGDYRFDVITALDVLEHLSEKECEETLRLSFDLLNEGGIFIFSGPGVFEKIRIYLGLSPTHLHSHSPFGWKRIINKAGFEIMNVETVEFPIFHTDFLRKKVNIFGKCLVIISKKEFER
ncbi:methyltransferase domain-containing protein [Methanospirillum sp.]|jgi:predicted TPR repeat methyltransferase|uniref:class I SAM-dependent methyltransferase n=1 Tax=Methanospirillum sp. TaxID=45200 RepID=UPI0035A0C18C